MKQIIILLCLMISGCVSNTPWQRTSISAPWRAPDKKAVVYTRMHDAFMLPCAQQQTAFETGFGWKINTSSVGYDLDELLGNSSILDSWPTTGKYFGRFNQRKPPYDLYMVAINPIVLIGISDAKREASRESVEIFSVHLDELIPVATDLPRGNGTSITVIHNEHGRLVSNSISLSKFPSSVRLGDSDYIVINMAPNKILIKRTERPTKL